MYGTLTMGKTRDAFSSESRHRGFEPMPSSGGRRSRCRVEGAGRATRAFGVIVFLLACVGFVGCGEVAPPAVVEVAYPQARLLDPLGPYQVTAVTAGIVTETTIHWALADTPAAVPAVFSPIPMTSRGNGQWVGLVPGAPPASWVYAYVEVSGPGGSSRTSTQFFQILPLDGTCRLDSDCPAAEICDRLENRCHMPPEVCGDDGDCSQDYLCIEGACRLRGQLCMADGDCTLGQVCVDGQCTLVPECQGDEDCPDGRVCIPPGTCADIPECEPGEPDCIDAMCGDDEHEPNDVLTEEFLATLAVGNPLQGRLCAIDVDVFVFFPPGDRIIVTADGPISVQALTPEGELLEQSEGGPSGTSILVAPPIGGFIRLETSAEAVEYRVELVADEPSQCGMDVFEPNQGPDDATILGGNGADLQGRICADDIDYFQLRRRPENAPGRVSLVPLDEAELQWSLRGERGEVYAEGSIKEPFDFDYPPVEETLYFVVQCAECQGNVRYRVTTDSSMMACDDDALAPNHDPDRSVSIPADVDIVDLVVCAGADDYFEFEKERGEEIEITLVYPEFGGSLVGEVIARRGRFRQEEVGEDGVIRLTIPERVNDGEYLLRVGLLGSGSNTYELRIESQ